MTLIRTFWLEVHWPGGAGRIVDLAQAALEAKAKNLSNFAHRVTLHRATMPSPGRRAEEPYPSPAPAPGSSGISARVLRI
jgi:hypothetical protein